MKTVGSYEAKTHLPRILKEVAAGEGYTITRHGVPVAKLLPYLEPDRALVRKVIDGLKGFRKGRDLGGIGIQELIREGRRF
jgi:prevent-host-death family protein